MVGNYFCSFFCDRFHVGVDRVYDNARLLKTHENRLFHRDDGMLKA
jgi:hypothetical protein